MSANAEAAAQWEPPVIEVDALLAPIPGDNPAGEPPSVLYEEIKSARRADDPQEPGKGGRDAKVADWRKVLELTTGALATRTKDLAVCGWMTEALVKLHGLAGLRDGLKVLRGLHERFWESFYPPPGKNGDLEGRANYVTGLGKWVAAALGDVPLTSAEAGGGVAYSYKDWLRSNRDSDEGRELAKAWVSATEATPLAFYEAAHATAEECWAEGEALSRVMHERFGTYNQGTGPLRETLEAVRGILHSLYEEKLQQQPTNPGAGEGGAEPEAAAVASDGNGAGPVPPTAEGPPPAATSIRSRQEAVSRLREVATFFRQTEPHSPVSYLVERAVSWSDMPLEAWLASVIKDERVLGEVRETLGVELSAGSSPPNE